MEIIAQLTGDDSLQRFGNEEQAGDGPGGPGG